MREARDRNTWRSPVRRGVGEGEGAAHLLLNYRHERPPVGTPGHPRPDRHRGANRRGHLHRPQPMDAGRPRLRRTGARAVADRRDPHRARRSDRALDARVLPAAGRCRAADHLRGRPHPRRPLVLDAAHAGIPGGSADPVDDRLVPGRGPGARPSDRDARRAAGTRDAAQHRGCAGRRRPPDRAVLGDPARVRHPAHRIADLFPRGRGSRCRSRRCGCGRSASSPTTPICTAPRWHTRATTRSSSRFCADTGLPWSTPGLKAASLDHAMWWHRFGRVDEWLLYVQESPNATGGRGLSFGRIYSRDGILLASVAQEGMVRVPSSRPADS